MPLFWEIRFKKLAKFFSEKKASEDSLKIANLEGKTTAMTEAILALQAQFKYLQQRVDKMEIPR